MATAAMPALPPKPYNVHTLGGRAAILWEAKQVTPDTFQGAIPEDLQSVALRYEAVRGSWEGPAEFRQFDRYRATVLERVSEPLSKEVYDLADCPAPWLLYLEAIPDVGAFKVFAQAGIVTHSAADALIVSARVFMEQSQSLRLSLSERARLALEIWGYLCDVPDCFSRRTSEQIRKWSPLVAAYGLTQMALFHRTEGPMPMAAFRSAFQADLSGEYLEIVGTRALSPGDTFLVRTSEPLPANLLVDLTVAGLIDAGLLRRLVALSFPTE